MIAKTHLTFVQVEQYHASLNLCPENLDYDHSYNTVIDCSLLNVQWQIVHAYENKFNNILKPQRSKRGAGQLGQRLLTATGKIWGVG